MWNDERTKSVSCLYHMSLFEYFMWVSSSVHNMHFVFFLSISNTTKNLHHLKHKSQNIIASRVLHVKLLFCFLFLSLSVLINCETMVAFAIVSTFQLLFFSKKHQRDEEKKRAKVQTWSGFQIAINPRISKNEWEQNQRKNINIK